MRARGPAGAPSPWQLVILAKAPRPGAAKTRLCPPLTPEQAAGLAAACLADTMAAALACTAGRRLLVLAGDPGPWRQPGFEVLAQRGDGLGQRLGHAFEDVRAVAPLPTLLVGMDTPQLLADDLDRAVRPLLGGEADTVLGPALDGGFWAIGTRGPADGFFTGVPMSTRRTGGAQLRRLTSLSLSCRILPARRDVDHWSDALAVAAEAPWTGFASRVRDLDSTNQSVGAYARA